MQKNQYKTKNIYNLNTIFSGKIFVVTLTMLLIFTAYSAANIQNPGSRILLINQGKSIVWDVTIQCNNPGGQNDFAVFGEAPDAHDGPPADSYDIVKPPAPQPPYIRAWFNDNLPVPYNTLWMDYRHYPGSSKVWNLTVHWMPSSGSSPTTITLSWNTADVDESEYISVTLCTNSGTPLQNMLMNSTYIFSCPAYVPQNFKIICVAGSNHPPVANPDSYSTNEDTTLTIAAPGVLANDVDVDGDTLTAVKMSDPSHGTVTLTSNGGFTYIPISNYHGTDTFTYKAYDGTVYSNMTTVTITVNSVNDPPVAIPDSYSTDEDTTLMIPAPGVLGNDGDVDGDTLTAVKMSDPSHGTVTLNNNGGFTYVPVANYHGTDSFTYKAFDGIAFSNVVTVTITVNTGNQPPVANNDTATVPMDSTNNKINVLANDVDADEDPLTITGVSVATHGTTTTDASFVYYTPTQGFSGSDSFTYTISDNHGGTDTATVSITIQLNAPPVKPQRPTGPSQGKVGKEYTYNATTTDPNNHQLSYQWDWGDGTTSGWLGPYISGELTQAKHTWTKKGSYGIKVKAKDIYDAESSWSESLPITMPVSQNYIIGGMGALIHLLIRFFRGEFADMTFIQVLRMEG